MILLTLLALSGMAAITSAEGVEVSMFYGTATLNDADAPPGTVIDAYIDGALRGSFETEVSGKYAIAITGNGLEDEGKVITFTVCGAAADPTAVWHASIKPRELNLSVWDTEAPAVTTATATPSSIVADGAETTQMNVTVADDGDIDVVTVNLSAIGGDEAHVMSRIGATDVYSVTVTANEGTLPGAYCLYVNASDVFGNYNTSVCIGLNVATKPIEYDSADTNHDCVVGPMELMTQIGKWKSGEVGPMELMNSIARWKLGTGGYC